MYLCVNDLFHTYLISKFLYTHTRARSRRSRAGCYTVVSIRIASFVAIADDCVFLFKSNVANKHKIIAKQKNA